MDSRRLRVSPALVVAGVALLFALGGSAFAIGQRAAVPQQRCQNGAVRALAVVTGIPRQGIENLPTPTRPTRRRSAAGSTARVGPSRSGLPAMGSGTCASRHLGRELPCSSLSPDAGSISCQPLATAGTA